MVSVYQSEEVPLPGGLNGELMVCVCQLVENLGCPLCCRAPVFHMWVPLPFRMPISDPGGIQEYTVPRLY